MIDRNDNSLMTAMFTCVFVMCIVFNINAQVGIATTTPNAQLDVVTTATTGNSIEVNHDVITNGSSAILVKNSGTRYGIDAQNLTANTNSAVIRVLQNGLGGLSHGVQIDMQNTTDSDGLVIFQEGDGNGIYNQLDGAGYAGIYNQLNGTGFSGIYNALYGGYSVGLFNNLADHGGIGELVELDDNDGVGVVVIAVNNPVTPTNGGDVYGFQGIMHTNTATAAGIISGSVFAGEQSGVGHGIIINHSGPQGRNAEFNINNAVNTDAAIFAISQGQGSAVMAQNQNNVITGTVYVGDFAYTGTDVADHVGVSGYSQPAAGWGIGVLGQGGWYGEFAVGNSGATGVKSFVIDHPEDPTNKILKHFSVESNEVLNMYRGVEVFDVNGKAIVSLPDYYDSINKNPSYQLTPIGAAMPDLYIEAEINNGQFVIAGGVVNKKVSWQITSERNDPYLQQNPKERKVVVRKEGERRGKYLTPELYKQSKEKGMFYNPNREKQTASEISDTNSKKLESIRAKEPKVIKEGTLVNAEK